MKRIIQKIKAFFAERKRKREARTPRRPACISREDFMQITQAYAQLYIENLPHRRLDIGVQGNAEYFAARAARAVAIASQIPQEDLPHVIDKATAAAAQIVQSVVGVGRHKLLPAWVVKKESI